VDFVDPVGIDPRIDIQAEADIRDYRVILLITGQGDDIQLTMRSDPALPQLEIVSLVAGGRTREELDREGRVSEEQLFQGAASNILADMLQSRVGSRLGVLNSVRIDPFLVGAENDPVARLTIAEQITSDLEITYSQDLSSNTQQVIQIEYFLNGDTSFIASRDESGRLGLDIKLRKRFD
jgi:autotransporter translocation and assembly factor TamB